MPTLVLPSRLSNAADDIIKAKLEKKPTGRGRGRGPRQGGEERTDKRLRVTVQDGGMKRKQPRRVSDFWLQSSRSGWEDGRSGSWPCPPAYALQATAFSMTECEPSSQAPVQSEGPPAAL